MKEKVRQAIRNFRRSNPHTTRWNDEQVLEAMFLLAAQQRGSRVRVAGRGSDGKVIFEIDLAADASDGFP